MLVPAMLGCRHETINVYVTPGGADAGASVPATGAAVPPASQPTTGASTPAPNARPGDSSPTPARNAADGGAGGRAPGPEIAGSGGAAGTRSAANGGSESASMAGTAGEGRGASAAAGPENAWRMMGYDHHSTYFNPAETTLSPGNASRLTEKWRFTINGVPMGSPVIAEGKVFATTSGGVYAIDLATGKQVWVRTEFATTSSAAYENGSIYVHQIIPPAVYKLKASDGSTVWGPSTDVDPDYADGESSPILARGLVIVGHDCGLREIGLDMNTVSAARGGVEAYDMESGAKIWTYYTLPDPAGGGENGASVWSSVSVDLESATVFATTGNNYTVAGPNAEAFHAIDLMTGTKKWVKQVQSGDTACALICGSDFSKQDMDFGANPILAEIGGRRVVAAGNKTSSFYQLDRDTGEMVWSRDKLSDSYNALFGGIFINGAFDGKYFYVVANDANTTTAMVHKLDPEKQGASVWTHKLDRVTWGAVSLANGLLVVPNDTKLVVMDAASGQVLTQFETGGTIAGGAAAIAQGTIVVKSGLVYAADVKLNDQIIAYGLP